MLKGKRGLPIGDELIPIGYTSNHRCIVSGSNDLELLKEEIKGLKKKNKDLIEKLTKSEAKSAQTTQTGEATSSKAKSKLTSTYL